MQEARPPLFAKAPSNTECFLKYLHSLRSSKETIGLIVDRAKSCKSAYVMVGNTHQCVLVCKTHQLWKAFESASVVTSDSRILAFTYLAFLKRRLDILRGWELTLNLCKKCEENYLPIALYGGTVDTLDLLKKRILNEFPDLSIVASISPPFRPLTAEERAAHHQALCESKAKVILVGLGCPKQELWMFDSFEQLNAVTIGVGAAFDFLSGNTKCSPKWVHQVGIEWLWRLVQDPRRLASRYLRYNLEFISLLSSAINKR